MIKYLLHPGQVRSRNDGDWHYISAGKIADLYGVKIEECRIYDSRRAHEDCGLIQLYPRYDGEYKLHAPHPEPGQENK